MENQGCRGVHTVCEIDQSYDERSLATPHININSNHNKYKHHWFGGDMARLSLPLSPWCQLLYTAGLTAKPLFVEGDNDVLDY
jgi:hypothetical protein